MGRERGGAGLAWGLVWDRVRYGGGEGRTG